MSILFALLIGIAVNLDNLIIGMNVSLRGQKLSLTQNLIIGGTTGVCAFLSTLSARLITGNFLVYTNIVGSLIMIFFGLYCLWQCRDSDNAPEIFENPDLKDIFFLSCVLAVNCIPPSFSAGVMNLSPLWIGASSMAFSCLSMWISGRMGQRLLRCPFFSLLAPASAILLILIGIGELLF